ncbi:MAG: hypothetical protein A3J97_14795 [Spirochaetes bacterium RIFOXYC1_FULL_54_7]|nr:MAG: hypothetical protein A3J97_14795 [Spirochaetes bacterium RIFOXYC1_FULL_54_7]
MAIKQFSLPIEGEKPSSEPHTLSPAGKALARGLAELRVQDLKALAEDLLGEKNLKFDKAGFCKHLAHRLDFKSQGDFDTFREALSPLQQKVLSIGAYHRYIPLQELEEHHPEPLVIGGKYDYSRAIVPEAGLGMCTIGDNFSLILYKPIADCLRPWLPPPADYEIHPVPEPVGAPWVPVDTVLEALQLALKQIAGLWTRHHRAELARKGLLKGLVKQLRASSGLPEFPIGGTLGLDSLELLARFCACFDLKPEKRPSDPGDGVKILVTEFLAPLIDHVHMASYWSQAFENLVCLDHLSRRPGSGYNISFKLPDSRAFLSKALDALAESVGWFDVRNLVSALCMRGVSFSYLDPQEEDYSLFLKGDSLTLHGQEVGRDYYGNFKVNGRFRQEVFVLPVFRAYCYSLAILGVLEIREAQPERPLVRKGRTLPLSPYDALKEVRLSDFGRWVIGKTDTRPTVREKQYEAVVDSELLVIAFKGNSLEHRLFLQSIGEQVGEERWRVTEASFMRGCTTVKELDQQASRFRSLLCKDPPQRWLEFFDTLKLKAGMFGDAEKFLVYKLPPIPGLRELFATDPQARKLVLKVEGGRIAVPADGLTAFKAFLAKHGFMSAAASQVPVKAKKGRPRR